MKEIHVSSVGNNITGNGSIDNPFKTIQYALSYVEKGTILLIHEGIYSPFVINSNCSGTKEEPVVIKPYENDKVVIQGIWDEESITVHVVNAENITLEGLEVIGGGLGIYVISDRSIGNKTLENITISNCLVHGVRGMHGIAVYAWNDLAPIKNLVMKNCEVYDCRLDSSESTVINGNIDGFDIYGNKVHDNNNIGIDMIGFEGKALHDERYPGNKYDVDFVRNGKCHHNFVYNISSLDNEAYYENPLASQKDTTGEYNLCANGIYVDGAQDIDIYDNFVYNCDIGFEVATEHSPLDNELFKVSGVNVYNNVIADCSDYTGLAFGGYDYNLGYTENCNFYNNTFIDGNMAFEMQRSRNNNVHHNLIVGCNLGIDYNNMIHEEDLVNNIENNIFCTDKPFEEFFDAKNYDLNKLLSKDKQLFVNNRNEVIENYLSKKEGYGANYQLKKADVENYEKYHNDGRIMIEKIMKYLEEKYKNGLTITHYENVCDYINNDLISVGFKNTKVELIKYEGNQEIVNCDRNENNGKINSNKLKENNNIVAEFDVFYCYDENSYAHRWLRKISINIK